jgi:protocatechuate 3,4-dioxygenase beta subunit
MTDNSRKRQPFIQKLINNIATLKHFPTITIFTAFILCVGALILFFSFSNYRNKSEIISFANDVRESHREVSKGNVNQQSLASSTVDHLSKNSIISQTDNKKSKSNLLNSLALNESLTLNERKKIYRDPKSVDIRTSAYPNFQEDNELSQLSISGYVFNQAGEPISGMEVSTFAKRLFQRIKDIAYAPSRNSTHTDINGFFNFQNLTEGEYEVSTKDTLRYRAAKAVFRTGVISAVLIVEEKLENWAYVYGNVANTMGTLLAGVKVVPIGQAGQGIYTDNVGNYGFSLAVRGSKKNYTIRFIREGYREKRLTLRDSDVYGVEKVQLNALMVPINELATVTGSVTDINGSPIHGARVQLYSANLMRSFQTVSDRSGFFSLHDVEIAPDYRLWVHPKDKYKDYIEEAIVVNPGGALLSVILEPLDIGSLTGQIVDLFGNPLPQFSLWLRSSYIQQYMLVTSDQNGYFFVKELPAGEISLETRSSPYFTIYGIRVSPGENKNVQLILDTGSYETRGQVIDSFGNPVPGAKVSLLWFHQGGDIRSRSSRKTASDGNGYFLFTQLGPDIHSVSVTAPGYRSAREDVDVNSDEVLIQLQEVLK